MDPRHLNETFTEVDTKDDEQLTLMEIFYYFLALVAIFLCCRCSRSRVPDQRFIAAAMERRARWLQRQEIKDRMSDPEYRMRLVLRGLVMKRIIDQRDWTLTLGDDEEGIQTDDRSETSLSIDSTDEKISTCAICLEPFRVGDIVGLNRTLFDEESDEAEECNHAFHKECIVAWLMQSTHDGCPSCRTLIVRETEEDKAQAESSNIGEVAEIAEKEGPKEILEPQPSFVLVIMHGLVARVRRAGLSLIGQDISSLTPTTKYDMEVGSTPPETPPSPLRRVYSLEGTALRHRPFRMRRQRSSGSLGKVADPSQGVLLPLVLEEPEAEEKPINLRRVASDFTCGKFRPPSASDKFSQSRHPLPFRPRGMSSIHFRRTDGLDLPTFDCSEHSICSEDEIAVKVLSPQFG